MKLKSLIVLSSVLMYSATTLMAQTEFYLNGYGRVITSNNKLAGNAVSATNPNKGISGYSLFDLSPTIKVGSSLKVNSTLRVKNQFGGFFGNSNALSFRQFQVNGKIGKFVNFDLGDINVGEGMSEYAVNNFDDNFNTYESKVFKQRREILEYENFNFGNKWRLQGAQARTSFVLNKLIDTLGIYTFVVRTVPNDEKGVSDRIMTGGRVSLVKDSMFTASLNYVGLLDLPASTAASTYKNNVFIGDFKYIKDLESIAIIAKLQTGISSYNFTNADTAIKPVSYNDYFYDGGVAAKVKGLGVDFFGTYKNVGPQYYNPASQTRRIDVSSTPTLFPTLGTDNRAMSLFDRYSNESQYNRTLATTLSSFMPSYNNSSPYGTATPNRTGFTLGLATDTSAKTINGQLKYEMAKELVGEHVVDLRSFNVLTLGTKLEIGKFLESTRDYTLSFGYRNEATKRSGDAPIDLKNSLLDFGLAIELPKSIDLLFGYKKLTSVGNEIQSVRDVNNLLTSTFTASTFDIAQNILSGGVNVRFSTASFFSVIYNRAVNTTGVTSKDYNLNQLFLNFTVVL